MYDIFSHSPIALVFGSLCFSIPPPPYVDSDGSPEPTMKPDPVREITQGPGHTFEIPSRQFIHY